MFDSYLRGSREAQKTLSKGDDWTSRFEVRPAATSRPAEQK